MKTFKFIGLFITITIFISCATSIPISLLCNEQHIEIYVDEEYVGRGQVNYIVPKGTDYIKVSNMATAVLYRASTMELTRRANHSFSVSMLNSKKGRNNL